MRFSNAAKAMALASLGTSVAASSWVPATTQQTDTLYLKGLVNLLLNQTVYQFTHHTSCNLENAAIRRDWADLSNAEKSDYISAVQCMMNKPSQQLEGFPTGAQNRFDDFVAVHINQTWTIHATANFLTWHRFFTWSWEQALRNECGYTGYQPYWNWAKTSTDIINSPYFDGSEYSLGGNGEYEAHNCTNAIGYEEWCIPAGDGGGCVTNGPFANMTANLGPVYPTLQETEVLASATATGLTYNPRCVKRDISQWTASNWLKDSDIALLINSTDNILDFQNMMQGNFSAGYYGVHTAGHYSYGNGDPGGDLFASPGDPGFFLHHGQIDRTFWIWQNQNIPERQYVVGGTITMFDEPPSRNGTFDDVLYLGNLANETITIYEALNTLAGPFCYIYV